MKELCLNCGEQEIDECSFGVVESGTHDNPEQFHCTFWWDDTAIKDYLDNIPECGYCPHRYCKFCKSTLIANAWWLLDTNK